MKQISITLLILFAGVLMAAVRWTPSSDQLEAKLSYGAGVDAGLVFLALVFKIELRRFANLGR